MRDGETVTVGDVSLTAHATPGHTRGCTTWTTRVSANGHSYNVVFADGVSINPGTRFVKAPSYPGIADDYRRTFGVLESLKPDIFLAYHAEHFDLDRKRQRAAKEGLKAWIDPDGYARLERVNVEASFTIAADGSVRDIRLQGRADQAFKQEAERALRQWRFDPASLPADHALRYSQTFVFAPPLESASREGCVRQTGSMMCRQVVDEGVAASE